MNGTATAPGQPAEATDADERHTADHDDDRDHDRDVAEEEAPPLVLPTRRA